MYIRNAQGQLMWIPPKGHTVPPPPTQQPTMEMLQQNMRNQMQRDEWARFNAPPPQDSVCFDDNFSLFEGSTMNGYRSVAPTSPAMGNNGNMMYPGQQPQQQQFQNRMDPPIPQVINSRPMAPMPRNPPRHNVVPPPAFRNGRNSQAPPMFTSPRNQPLSNAGPAGFRNGANTQPMFTGPRNPNPSNIGPPSFRNAPNAQPYLTFTSPRNHPQVNVPPPVFRNGPNPHPMFTIPRNPSNLSRASVAHSVARSVARHSSQNSVAHSVARSVARHSSQNSVAHSVARSVARHSSQNSVAPTPFGIPENTASMPTFTGPRKPLPQKFTPSTFGIPEESAPSPMVMGPQNTAQASHNVPTPPSFDGSEDSPPYHDIKLVPEEKIITEPKISCMATLFGSSIDEHQSNYRSTKGLVNCNALNISTTSDDEDESRDDTMSYFSQSQKNGGVFKCNGIRGPGKKFDSFGERRTDSMDSDRDSKMMASVNEKTEKFLDALQMDNFKISEDQDKTEFVASQKSSYDSADSHDSETKCKETLASYETGGATVEDDEEESIENQRSVIDHGSMTTQYITQGAKEEGCVNSESKKYKEFIKRAEKPQAVETIPPVETDYSDDSKNFIKSPSNAEHRTTVKALGDGPSSTKKPVILNNDFPSFDEPDFPSFDEPAKSRTEDIQSKCSSKDDDNTNELPKMCALTESSSDGENNQKKANIWTFSASKEGNLKVTKGGEAGKSNIWTITTSKEGNLNIAKGPSAEMPLGNSSVVN